MKENFSIIITINQHKNITFLIKNIYKNKYILIDQIKNKIDNNDNQIKILDKLSSTIIYCWNNSNNIVTIIELILNTKDFNNDDILLKLNNSNYFLIKENITKFNFIKNINIVKNINITNINFKLFTELKYLYLYNDLFNIIDLVNNLPEHLEIIKFNIFNKQLDYMIPELELLDTGHKFNSPINISDTKLKKLIFGYSFNQEVNNLPETLEMIKFGYSFNKSVDNLPTNIHSLYFGYSFNQNVSFLPETIETLSFDYSFNQDISNLPIGIKNLIITSQSNKTKCKFKQHIDCIPNNIENLTLLNIDYDKIIHKLPTKLNNIFILTKFAYKINKSTSNTNILDIRNIIKNQKLNCEINLID